MELSALRRDPISIHKNSDEFSIQFHLKTDGLILLAQVVRQRQLSLKVRIDFGGYRD